MTLLNFKRIQEERPSGQSVPLQAFLKNYSIEVMPRTAKKIANFRDLLPSDTRVYLAHIEGTPIANMVATAKRLAQQGFPVMPHFPARIINDKATLADWIARYQGEAGVDQALLLAGGIAKPHGTYHSSMQLMESGLFDLAGFKRLHVAGHPEGNRDIEPDVSNKNLMQAIGWKQAFKGRTDAEMALVTQFCFDAAPVKDWANGLQQSGIDIPVHIGVAGPAKLQTLIKFAIACGVGPSLKVLQKRARDLSKLLLPFSRTKSFQSWPRTKPRTRNLILNEPISSRLVASKPLPIGPSKMVAQRQFPPTRNRVPPVSTLTYKLRCWLAGYSDGAQRYCPRLRHIRSQDLLERR